MTDSVMAGVPRRLKMLFGLAGLPTAGELHGDMTQAARLESLERFRKVSARAAPEAVAMRRA
jgi:hypothetical protein